MTELQAIFIAWEVVTGKRKRVVLNFRTKGEAKRWLSFIAHKIEQFTRPVAGNMTPLSLHPDSPAMRKTKFK